MYLLADYENECFNIFLHYNMQQSINKNMVKKLFSLKLKLTYDLTF